MLVRRNFIFCSELEGKMSESGRGEVLEVKGAVFPAACSKAD